MANYSTLKASVNAYIKANGVRAITGPVLNGILTQMINTLGDGARYGGIATPAGNPGTVDNVVFYLAFTAGTYTNYGGVTLDGSTLHVFVYDGTWADVDTGVPTSTAFATKADKDEDAVEGNIAKFDANGNPVDAGIAAEKINQLGQEKLDKIIGDNLIDPSRITYNKAINWAGYIVDVASSNYGISDFIPVNGHDIISNATYTDNTWATYAVFDANKNLLRSGQANQQYTYQSGDYYVVFSWAATSAIRAANYGDELKVEPFTDFAPLTNLEKTVGTFASSILEISNKVDKVSGTNIINPSEVISGAALPYNSTDGVPTTGLASHYCVTGYIPINGQSIISNAFSRANTWATMFIYGATKNFLRSNGTNQQYTYQEGDYFVRISYNTSTVSNQKANYGTTLLPYEPYTEFKPIQDVQNTINMVASETGESYKETNIIDVGEGYTYTDIQPAIESINDASATNRYLIRIHDDYNITDVTKLWLLSNPLSHASGINASCAFIITKSFVDLCGAGRRVKISVKLPAVDSSSAQQLNCHCVYESGDIRISNIEFESEYTRYTIHEENGGGSLNNANSNKKKVFKNVVLRYLKGTKYNAALGIGTAPGEDCLYENCVIESYAVNGSIKDGVGNLHSHPNYAYPFKYVFRNCIISTANYNSSTIYTDIRSGVKPTFVFEGCDFGSIRDFRSPTGLGGISLSDKAADWRNGGFYLEGHANRGVLGRTTVPCLYLSSTDNNVSVNVVGGTAYSLLFGDAVVNYPGTSDAKGVYLGSQYILANSVWSLQERLGDCSSENKTLIVSVGGVEQTISLNQDYSSLSDADIIADINSKLSGCSVAKDMLYQQLHWSDNVKLIINSGSETIKVNSILTDNGGLHNVKLANSGDIAVGIATERINPGATGLMIVKSEQYMQGSGVGYYDVVGTKYKCGDDGMLIQDNTDAAQFICINAAGIFKWI